MFQRGGVHYVDAEPVIVYGIKDSPILILIDEDWLDDYFPDIGIYLDIIHNNQENKYIYGYELELDQTTGTLSALSADKIEQVRKLFNILIYHHQTKHSVEMPTIGYFNAISGEGVNEFDDLTYIPTIPPIVTEPELNDSVNPLPRNAVNAITYEPILEGTQMRNFHGESQFGRYYTKESYNSLPTPKRNPHTRTLIQPGNVKAYVARLKPAEGGKNKTRKHRK